MHSVSFSASGSRLAWVGHDSSVNVLDGNNGVKYVLRNIYESYSSMFYVCLLVLLSSSPWLVAY